MRKPFIGDFLRSRVLFFSDNFGDFFSLSCVRRIVVDTVFIEKSVSEKEMAAHFIDFAGKALAVIDLFVYNAVNIETPIIKRSLSFAKDAVISALTLNPDASEETVLRLFREDCLFGLSDYALGGDLVCNSAEYSFFRLAGKKSVALGYEFLRRAYNLYLLACDNFDPFRVPDHVLRSEKLKNLTGKDDGWFLRGFSEQTSKLNGGAVDKILTEVKDTISSLNNFAEFLQSAYIAYGESPVDFSPYIDALKSSGDLPTTFNFMTFVRERGLLE